MKSLGRTSGQRPWVEPLRPWLVCRVLETASHPSSWGGASQGEDREQVWETLQDPGEGFGLAAEWGGGTWWVLSRAVMWSDFIWKRHRSWGGESTVGEGVEAGRPQSAGPFGGTDRRGAERVARSNLFVWIPRPSLRSRLESHPFRKGFPSAWLTTKSQPLQQCPAQTRGLRNAFDPMNE